MPEGAISTGSAGSTGSSAPPPSTSIPTGGAGGGTSTPEPKVTWGPQDEGQSGADKGQQAVDDTRGGDEIESFGDESFDDAEFEAQSGEKEAEFTPQTYQKLKEALKADPALFKQVKRAISEMGRFKQFAKSPEELGKTFERLETLGGLDGIEAEAKEWGTVFEMFRSGDQGVIDYWAKDNPDGLVKLYPHVYDRMQQMAPEVWNHKAAETFMATAQQSGLVDALSSLYDIPGIADNAQAKKLLDKITGVIRSVNEHANKQPVAAQAGGDEKIKQKERELSQKENVLYQREVSAKVAPVLKTTLGNEVSKMLKGKTVTKEGRASIFSKASTEYNLLAKGDADFQKNAKALLNSGETEKFVKLVTSHVQRTMPRAARRAWQWYAGITGQTEKQKEQVTREANSRREAGGGGVQGSTIKTATPNPRDVDWGRMRAEFGKDKADDMFLFQRKYYKKGDKNNTYQF